MRPLESQGNKKSEISISFDFSIDILIRNENIIFVEIKT